MKRKKIVTIGGGTGSFMLLSGLRKYSVDISAIVSMADDGGSTGVLRDELGVLPPGDIRQCLVALSDSSDVLRELMNYRFEIGGLKGHSFGNLFLSALEKIKGNFPSAVEEASKILNVKGEVIPVTNDNIKLCMKLSNGSELNGEAAINKNETIESLGIQKNYLYPKARANKNAIRRILEADLLVIGPGNHYCSVLPNLLVSGIAQAIRKSKATVVYNCNLVNQKGHTEKFNLNTYADMINEYIGKDRLDYVIYNTKKPSQRLIEKYENQRALLIDFPKDTKRKGHYKVIQADVLSGKRPNFSIADKLSPRRAFIRHEGDKLAKVLMIISELGEYENMIKEIV